MEKKTEKCLKVSNDKRPSAERTGDRLQTSIATRKKNVKEEEEEKKWPRNVDEFESVRPSEILGLCDGRVIHPGAWNACSYTTNRMAD
jgi:hypothetical protein